MPPGSGRVSGPGRSFSTELPSQDTEGLKQTHSDGCRGAWGVWGAWGGSCRPPWGSLGLEDTHRQDHGVQGAWYPSPHRVGCVATSPPSEGDTDVACGDVGGHQTEGLQGWRAWAGTAGGAGALGPFLQGLVCCARGDDSGSARPLGPGGALPSGELWAPRAAPASGQSDFLGLVLLSMPGRSGGGAHGLGQGESPGHVPPGLGLGPPGQVWSEAGPAGFTRRDTRGLVRCRASVSQASSAGVA